jgi:3-oxoacyl-[acyl-carrier protein] reductase
MRLADKVAVITGAGRGIGRAVAARFAAEGAAVVINDVDATRGEEAASEIARSGGKAAFVRADVSDEDDVAELFAQAFQRYGGVDVLVNNAVCPASHIVADEWQPTIDVVLKGTMSCSKAALESMLPPRRQHRQRCVGQRADRPPGHPCLQRRQGRGDRPDAFDGR